MVAADAHQKIVYEPLDNGLVCVDPCNDLWIQKQGKIALAKSNSLKLIISNIRTVYIHIKLGGFTPE